jgi:hypothetical protein
MIDTELGIRLDSGELSGHFEQCSLQDLLNSITCTFRALIREYSRAHIDWHSFVTRVLEEENVGYRLDRHGGIHPAVDAEFERSMAASLAALGLARYTAAREAFEGGEKHLGEPKDARAAIRGVFDAAETVFKLLFPQASRLGDSEVRNLLKPLLLASLTGAERHATGRVLEAFGDWVNACHQYRHAQGVEEPDPPSDQFALLMFSGGAAYLRWLVGIDQQRCG